MTTAQTDESRFVTKIRWAVEAVHGIIKQKCRILNKRFDNNLPSKIGIMLKIVRHLNILYGKRLSSDRTMFDEVCGRMLQMRDKPNELGDVVAQNNWNLVRRPWREVSSDVIDDFPDLAERQLIILYTGSYQLGQSVSYLAEMLKEDETIDSKYHRDHSNILKLLVQSLHGKKEQHRCYIAYDPTLEGIEAIKGHCCECRNGARTVGSCSHVATAIYFLSHARYQYRIIRPAEILTNLNSHDFSVPVIEENSDEED